MIRPAALHAQAASIAVEVRELDSGRPVPAALVSLRSGVEVISITLSDATGRALLNGRLGARYKLIVERVGYLVVTSDSVHLTATAQMRTVFVSSRPIALAAVAVRAQRQCEQSARDTAITLVWTEARKALESSLLPGAAGTPAPVRVRRFVRELSTSMHVEREELQDPRTSRQAFISAPAEELSRHGYVRDSAGRAIFYAPDAEVLLSDPFAADHCFSIVRQRLGDTTFIGLAFEPNPVRDQADLKGTLWLTESDAQLRSVEFSYVNLADSLQVPGVGGRMEFARLPDGRWAVARWHIRTPRLAYMAASRVSMLSVPRRLALIGFLEEGGDVDLRSHANGTFERSDEAYVAGLAYDSSRGVPLEGARITLVGTTIVDTTRSDGSFLLQSSLAGAYTLELSHPRLHLLGGRVISRPVRLERSDTARVTLSLPSLGTVIRERCPSADTAGADVMLLGRLIGGDAGTPVAGARVEVRWGRAQYFRRGTLTAGGMDSSLVQTASDSMGAFFACGIPRDATLSIAANSGALYGSVRRSLNEPASVRHIEQILELARNSSAAGAVRVRVSAPDSGIAPRSVRVSLPWLARDVPLTSNGHFIDHALPSGPQLVVVQAIGFAPIEQLVDVPSGDTAVVDLVLRPVAIPLPRVEVEGIRGNADFVRRRAAQGGGTFLDRTSLARWEHTLLSQALRAEAPGLRVLRLSSGGAALASSRDAVTLGGRRTNACFVQIFLNGSKLFGQSQLARSVTPPDLDSYALVGLEAIEIYTGPAVTPPEFYGHDAACGTLVIWTRRE